jgi:hypothetical protein
MKNDKYERVWQPYGRGLPKVSDVWIKIKCQIQIYTIVSHHNFNKSITITYIAKYENTYITILTYIFYLPFSRINTLLWVRVNFNCILAW